MSATDFNNFFNVCWNMFRQVYIWLSSITIADVSLFTWLIGFACFGVIVSVVHMFAGTGFVSMSWGVGKYEASRSAASKSRGKMSSGDKAAYDAMNADWDNN